jgi:hypothetical protein
MGECKSVAISNSGLRSGQNTITASPGANWESRFRVLTRARHGRVPFNRPSTVIQSCVAEEEESLSQGGNMVIVLLCFVFELEG